jgi:myo-inositol catabolism protein IolH
VESKRGSECLLKSVSNIDFNPTIHQHLNPGEGEVDFDTLYKMLHDINFDGIVTNNVFAWPDKIAWSNEKTLLNIKNGLNLK